MNEFAMFVGYVVIFAILGLTAWAAICVAGLTYYWFRVTP